MADSKIRVCRDDDMKLNEICEVYSGYALKAFNDAEDGFPVIKIGNIFMDGTLNLEECQYTTDGVNEKYYSQRGDIYIALSGATTGKIGIMDASEKYVINQRVGIVRQKSADSPQEYIKYFLLRQTDRILQEAAGCAQPNISPRQIAEYVVPDTSQEKMQEICEVLDRIKKIIDSRKVQISALDNLIKARFVEMFGDPVANEKGWTTKPLLDMGKCKNGMNFHYDDKGIEINCLGVGDFKNLSIIDNTEELPTILLNEMPSEEYLLKDDDIVFVRSNGNKALVGRSLAVYPGDVPTTFSGFCIRYRKHDNEITVPYLLRVLKTDSMRMKMAGRGANIQNLNQQILGTLVIPVPPVELQNQFAAFVTEVNKSKVKVQKALDETQKLFDSLMQQYFG